MPDNRQLAALLFTDIEGYTALMQKDEQQAISLRNRHREVLQREHKQFDGQIVQYYGDGVNRSNRESTELAEYSA